MSLLRVDSIQNRFLTGGPVIVGLTTIAGNLICSGITSITDGLLVSAATTTATLNVQQHGQFNRVQITGIATVGIVTGGTYFGQGVNLTGIVTNLVAGAGVNLTASEGTGKGEVTITVPSAGTAGFANTAGVATDVQGGAAGQLVFQDGPSSTNFVAVGDTGFILQANGAGAPSWTQFTSINVGFADTAGIATNIVGGSDGQLVFQTTTDTTGFVTAGISNQVLISQGSAGPTYVNQGSLNVGFATLAGIATNVIGGAASVTQLNVGPGISTFAGIVTTTSNVFIGTTSRLIVGGGLTVSGASTFTGITTFGNDVFVEGDLRVKGDIFYDEISGTNLNITGVATIQQLGVTGIITSNGLEVTSGLTTLGVTTTGNLFVGGATTISGQLGVGGTSIFDTDVGIGTTNVKGAADPNNTTILNAGIVTAVKYFGDGTALIGVNTTGVTNVLYVNVDGDDNNTGKVQSEAKRTVGAALSIATESTVIKVAAGTYSENNPLVMPEQVSIDGDSLRDVSLTPQNPDEDFIYVGQGNYVGDVSFTGTLNEGKAIIAFNPNKPSYVTAGPYIRNCTNFISNSIGMKIDGAHVIGDTRAMNVDSYTQYNQGGIGVSISNDGYAQLVSIFTICNDQSIVCQSGGQCDLTNSNSSFGRLGLVADGVGGQNFIGTVATASAVNADTFTLNVGVSTATITNAVYDNVSGLVTVTTSADHGFNVGMSVTMKDMEFTCDSSLPVTTFSISTANYTASTGIMTVQTSTNNNFQVGASVTFSNLTFRCDSGGGPSNATFPPAAGDGNGAPRHVFDVITVGTSTEFTVNVGPSTIAHDYQSGGNVAISTFAPFPSGAYGHIFNVNEVVGVRTFTAFVGVSSLAHTYVSGGEVETYVSRPYDGQVLFFNQLFNTLESITVTDGGSNYTIPPIVTIDAPSESWGIRATATAELTNGSVTGINVVSSGRGYTSVPNVTFSAPPGGIGTAVGTAVTTAEYYIINSATPIVNGITTVTLSDNVPFAVGVGTTVPFFKQSKILASSQAFEYIGSGNTINVALPQRGGVVIPENEIVNRDGGLVVYTSTDQAGNFKIGDGVIINQQEGSISGDAYTRSLFANITPYILALGGGD